MNFDFNVPVIVDSSQSIGLPPRVVGTTTAVQNHRRLFESRDSLIESRDTLRHEELKPMNMETPPPAFIPPPPPPPPPQQPMDMSVTFSALGGSSPREQLRSRSVSPTKSKRSASPKSKYPGSRDVKRIRVNEPKPGRIYPSLTDIESATETEAENEIDERIHDQNDDDEMENYEDDVSIESGFSLGNHIQHIAERAKAEIEDAAAVDVKVTPMKRNPHYRPTEDVSTFFLDLLFLRVI